jgi:pimeloyl-ACP methyl ester carboxylesterase
MTLFRSLVGPLAASVDRLASVAITGRSASSRRRSRAESLGHPERVIALDRIIESYASAEPLEDVDRFFGARDRFEPVLTPVGERQLGGTAVEVLDARWPSSVDLFSGDARLREKFGEMPQNHDAAARLFLGREAGRPAVILVHGYRAGAHAVEERVWPLQWLVSRGLDVAFFVLPFHGIRTPHLGDPRFLASDPRFTNESFRQAIGDLRGLRRYLLERGAPSVGAMGMSLGGYTVSLLATVEPLDFVAPMIPLASIADVALASGRFVGTAEEQALQHEKLERAHRVVSPFARASKVRPEAAIVVAGEGDRITPLSHAEKLSRHFGSELVKFPGGHLLQIGRSEGFRAIGRMLGRQGFLR